MRRASEGRGQEGEKESSGERKREGETVQKGMTVSTGIRRNGVRREARAWEGEVVRPMRIPWMEGSLSWNIVDHEQ